MGALALAALACSVYLSSSASPDGAAPRALRFAAQDASSAVSQQRAIRKRLFRILMDGGKPRRVPLAAQIVHREEDSAGGRIIEEITFKTLPDHRAHVWLSLPTRRTGRVPVVLALHGHGGTGEQVVRGEGLYWYGRALAEMGYAVISPDIGTHDLRNPKWTLMGERTWDAVRCLDYVETRPELDAKRIGVCGLSLGGETTMYVAALDERVRVVDSAGWLTTIANMKNGHCPCWNSPGLEEAVDFADIFACVAPRPIVFEIGEKERAPGGFPVDVARCAFAEVQQAYAAFDAEEQAVLDVHAGGHVFVGRSFWQPLRETLGTPYPWRASANTSTDELLRRGEIARRAFQRSLRLVDGWWALRDAETSLYPRRTDQPVWAPQDNAADMLPFLLITAHTVAPDRLPALTHVIETEQKWTNRVGVLPDWWSIKDRKFEYPGVDMVRILFGAAEYCKDGLIPMTEVMGRGPWTDRMLALMDAISAHASVRTDYGVLAANDAEVNGDLLQALARLYSMTGDRRYLEWMTPIADAFCFEVMPKCGGLPVHRWDFERHQPIADTLNLNDHGNEIIGGLTEFYIAMKKDDAARAAKYREPLLRMFRRLLEIGRNQDGLWYNLLRPATGTVLNAETPDTWGYAMSAAWSFGKAADAPELVEAAEGTLANIDRPAYYQWNGADSYADSIEGALLLLNRIPSPQTEQWLNTVLPIYLAMQRDDGIVEGWYGDGNSARTWLMAALHCTQGTRALPWRQDLRFGAAREANGLRIALQCETDWSGRLYFDTPRHAEVLHLPWNYARLNEFPEWFVLEPGATYTVRVGGKTKSMSRADLERGLPVTVPAGRPVTVSLVRQAR